MPPNRQPLFFIINPSLQIILFPLVAGVALDLALGDPRWLPHPIVGYGRAIAAGERRLNRGSHRARFLKGATLALALVSATWLAWAAILALAARWHGAVAVTIATLGVFTALSHRTLVAECRAVFRALGDGSRDNDAGRLAAARRQLSRIVGRDTARLDAQQIRTATLETLSENLSDGVVAPLFWYALGGVPAMMACKMVNTLDSMIGHRDGRYEFFGKAAARLDDAANYFPARLTALLLAAASRSARAFRFIVRYGRAHASPNSGYPEAALAGALDARFGGPHDYDGERIEKPFIGENPRAIRADEITHAIRLSHVVLAFTVALVIAARVFPPPPFSL
ncbi:adenosylcobinamide-phosphate synthase [Ereboglobus sp. PH5-10]|uniref:adenosylcobinamide-phosphate synthase CbiB n=1 Tax=Ereboglobus sp. PH5-10 TaxID=2940629 RepID=UPI002406DE84|nr:adenosylcobinamide-phosphate synthase CbiB [Ereboglobus sp. PH5-10]MDF9827182.1 adenosylcobinamide-phosphate synthase [Ereboglobus sp. PH5-10]